MSAHMYFDRSSARASRFERGGALMSCLFAISVLVAIGTATIAIYKAHLEFIVKPREATDIGQIRKENESLRTRLRSVTEQMEALDRENLRLKAVNEDLAHFIERTGVPLDSVELTSARLVAEYAMDGAWGNEEAEQRQEQLKELRELLSPPAPKRKVAGVVALLAISVVSALVARRIRARQLESREIRQRVYA